MTCFANLSPLLLMRIILNNGEPMNRTSISTLKLALLATAYLTTPAAAQQTSADQESEERDRRDSQESRDKRSQDIVVTGERYTGGTVSIGKSAQSRREIPQSISIITRQQLDDRNFTKLEDVVKQTTGVTITRFDGGGNFNSIQSRGFDIGAIQLDGIPIPQGANFATALDAAIYEQIEVLRGPAGLLQGGGEPGGAINLVRKRALYRPALGAAVQLGSFDFHRAEVDLTGPLIASGALRGRVVGVIDRRDSHIVTVSNNKWLGYGTLELDITPATTLSAGYSRQEVRAGYDRGLPTFPDGTLIDLPVSSAVILRGTRQDLDTEDAFVELEHRLDNGGQIKFSARNVDRFLFYKFADSNSQLAPNGDLSMGNGEVQSKSKDRRYDLYFATPFQFGGLDHRLLIGASRNSSDFFGGNFAPGPALDFNLFAPDYDMAFPPVTLPGFQNVTKRSESAVYGQLQLSISDRLKLLGGGRLSYAEVETVRLGDGMTTSLSKPGGKFTPQLAVLYDVSDAVTAYTSYAETFVVQTALDAADELLPPRTGSQIEFGVKGEFFDSGLQAHAAVFRINDKNRAIADPDVINASIPGGEVRSQGFELEASGQVARGWDVLAGYAFTDTKFIKAPVSQLGMVFSTVTPRHSLNLFTRYAFPDNILSGLSVGGGVSYRSEFFAQSGPIRIVSGNYALINAQLGYEIGDNWSLNLTADNLFNKKYYEKVSGTVRQNFYGEPRRVALALRASF